MSFTIVVHHGGQFVRDWIVYYRGGSVTVIEGINKDKWNYLEAEGIVRKLKYGKNSFRMWWKVEVELGYKMLRLDKDADDIVDYAINNKVDAHIYVEHDVGNNVCLVDAPICLELQANNDIPNNIGDKSIRVGVNDDAGEYEEGEGSDENETNSSEDEAKGIHFDDSEDERALGLDDGFGSSDDDVDPEFLPTRMMVDGQTYNLKTRLNHTVGGSSSSTPAICNVPDSSLNDQFVMETEYVSEELGSSDPDDSDNEKGPKYDLFRMEDLNKDYKFKKDLQFKSLEEFKEAIMKWNVFQGRNIKFVKNDKERVRVVCKKKCGFVALVSRVGGKHTFMMKTWHGIHSCTRDPNNKTATAKWVAQLILNTMSTSDHMKVNDILTHVRKNFSVNISFWRAWKAKQMAKEIVEGNAARQYNLLWRYSAELRRVSDNGNTCKITIERPHPTLQPRFGSFYFSFDGCKKGFLKACRPFIGVDGCHLKTRYGGQLLIAVGRDPNDQYFPLDGVEEEEEEEEEEEVGCC
ncbi:unnamed protein product [Trifolium pratense]|uniref:Uncharacterized protein n=1 Tax=Trifolium pratense TaxID=57577 RepID=A0ACB0K508_TRIPR|nr:unnamed protein product [Trifolium pratense]